VILKIYVVWVPINQKKEKSKNTLKIKILYTYPSFSKFPAKSI